MEEQNLEDIFLLLKETNKKIDNRYNDILNLDLKIDVNHISILSEISSEMNKNLEQLDNIYYHLLGNDNNIEKSNELKGKIKDYEIENKIKKTFLPYMMLMRITLENQN